MTELFPISELVFAALFLAGLTWMRLRAPVQHPRRSVARVIAGQELARLAAPQYRFRGGGPARHSDADFPSATFC